jgi:hypothetical protein
MVLSLLLVAPVSAQDETPEPAPEQSVVEQAPEQAPVPSVADDGTLPVEADEAESDPAQARLRLVIIALVVLAVLILIATIWFWRSTKPRRRADAGVVSDDATSVPSGSADEIEPEIIPIESVVAGAAAVNHAATVAAPIHSGGGAEFEFDDSGAVPAFMVHSSPVPVIDVTNEPAAAGESRRLPRELITEPPPDGYRAPIWADEIPAGPPVGGEGGR